ncbi:S8/S53 family peptidase [uncultured Dokdonia sp.]|uniref:S8/S53 family peptidase n=1 Tax=uncultured Dokdonia sp. TaxID=575653 RepID=UPI00261C6DC1|nr:S8/S53 family peptidase [uncultured Dokdonia sp.]
MRSLVVAVFYFVCSTIYSQNQDYIYIKFDPNINLQNTENFSDISGFDALQSQYSFTIKKGLALSNEKIEDLSKNGHSLKNIFKIESVNPNQDIDALVKGLKALPYVVYCYKSISTPMLPPSDIPPVTPNFELEQGYIESDPGVDMRYAWSLGIIGSGIHIKDIEYGLNMNHEDLNDQNVTIEEGFTVHPDVPELFQNHGTSVAGIIISDRGFYGASGLGYGAEEFILYPEWTQEENIDRVRAISSAIEDATIGDIIVFEIQTIDFEPGEYEQVVWDLTKAATDAGIIIVAAAGNGSLNLDDPFYQEYIDRGDSGAIIIGAGTPDTNHEALSFSNFGSRVDVQGWGFEVFTTGIGDIEIGNDINQTYRYGFAGTSSATAIVSGCVAVLQGYYHDLTAEFLSSVQLRDLLVETGIPQGEGVHIGPLPNMENAINAIQEILSVEDPNTLLSFISPNPSSDYLNISLQNISSSQVIIRLYNTLGEQLLSKNTQEKNSIIDVQSYATGIYFLEVVSGNDRHIKKVIIN